MKKLMLKDLLEWIGCITGLLGSFLLAAKVAASGFGWALFIISNICWAAYAIMTRARGMLLMQLGFTVANIIGIFRWLLLMK